MPERFLLEPFGQIETSSEDYWEATLSYGERKVRLDLNTDLGAVSSHGIEQARVILSDIRRLDSVARSAICEEYLDAEGDARLFQSHHLECLSDDAWQRHLGHAKPHKDDWDRFWTQCRLHRVGIYIEDTNQFAIFDYTLGDELTDYILSVSFDSSGTARSVLMES